jgi:hypothetical protein
MTHRTTLTAVALVLLLAGITLQSSYTTAAGKKKMRVGQTVTGIVQDDVVTAGGDCPHKYWLKVETGGPVGTLIALEPEDKVKAEWVKKRVKINGTPGTCEGTEGQHPKIEIQTITPIK